MIDHRKQVGALLIAAVMAALMLLSGCSSDVKAESSTSSGAGGTDDELYRIAFSTSPGTVHLNENVVLNVNVTKDGAPVKDADVLLELWPKDADASNHAQLIGKADGKGNYSVKGQFAEEGTYYGIAHVTPKDTGRMTMAGFGFVVENHAPPTS